MIGNDIVDLEVARAQSNWKRNGFLQKIFTTREQEYILKAAEPDRMVWLLWAMKEAAYKAHQRRFDLPRFFSPNKFSGTLLDQKETSVLGSVSFDAHTYQTRAHFNSELVHCVASYKRRQKYITRITNPSEEIKTAIIKDYAYYLNISEELKLVKNKNFIPCLSNAGSIIPANFSLSHHGKFSAYAIELTIY